MTRLRFRLCWRDTRLAVEVTHEQVRCTLPGQPGARLVLRLYGEEVELTGTSPDDDEQGRPAWLERLVDLAEEPLVEPERGQPRARRSGDSADGGQQHRVEQQHPQLTAGRRAGGCSDGCQPHRLHELDPAVVAAVGQCGAVEVERPSRSSSALRARASSASCRLANPSTTSSFMPLPHPLCRVRPRHLADPGRSAG
jgi:glycosyl hydrolase family 65